MIQFLTNESIEKSIALGNFLEVDAPEFVVDKYPAYYLRQSPAAQRKINQINLILRSVAPAWKAPEVVISYGNKVIILLLKISANIYEESDIFPHELLSKCVAAAEIMAEQIVNPSANSDRQAYLAHDRDGPSLDSLLDDINLERDALKQLLPRLAIKPDDGVKILITRITSEAKPIQLPPTEALRQTEPTTEKDKSFRGQVIGTFPFYNYVALEDGRIIDPSPHDSRDFTIGLWYKFQPAGYTRCFSERVYPVTCNMEESSEQPAYFEHSVNHDLFKK